MRRGGRPARRSANCSASMPARCCLFLDRRDREPLPVDRLIAGPPRCVADLAADHWHAAAHGIMTTRHRRQGGLEARRDQRQAVVSPASARAPGLTRPNTATMLGFVATDAEFSQPPPRQLAVRSRRRSSFNCIAVDTAIPRPTTPSSSLPAVSRASISRRHQGARLRAVQGGAHRRGAASSAQAIVRDGEGATKSITIAVEGGRDHEECKRVGYAIGLSPLVKTAFFAPTPTSGASSAPSATRRSRRSDVEHTRVWLGSRRRGSAGRREGRPRRLVPGGRRSAHHAGGGDRRAC